MWRDNKNCIYLISILYTIGHIRGSYFSPIPGVGSGQNLPVVRLAPIQHYLRQTPWPILGHMSVGALDWFNQCTPKKLAWTAGHIQFNTGHILDTVPLEMWQLFLSCLMGKCGRWQYCGRIYGMKHCLTHSNYPDSKVHGANMGHIWGRQDPGGPHVGPMNFAIWV